MVYNFRGDLVVARLGLDLQAVAGFIVLAKEVLRLLFEIDEQRDWHFFGFYGIVGLVCGGGGGKGSFLWNHGTVFWGRCFTALFQKKSPASPLTHPPPSSLNFSNERWCKGSLRLFQIKHGYILSISDICC